ncbi:MAG: alkaline phosphatase D family protein, partial [Betaproteobacteria bacterium]
TVRIWIQATDVTKARIVFRPVGGKDEESLGTKPVMLEAQYDHSAILEISDLKPDTRYQYTVSLTNRRATEKRYFRTAPASNATPADFRVYMGSCAYTEAMSPSGNPYGDEFHIFNTVASQIGNDKLPHFMLWLGDNLYLRPKGQFLSVADFDSTARMEARYRDVRRMDMFQKLFASTHHYAIWDDHDFGPNDSYRNFPLKEDALRLFRQYWPNPDMGSRALPGTWTMFSHQDADFFLLDDRFYRDDEKAEASESKTMFGAEQIAWLKQSLRKSKAVFKLVANGSQLLSEHDNGTTSGWHSYKTERDNFLAWLAKEKIPGIVFLSGDRHNTQVFRLKQDGAPVVYEFSCSPFTSRLSKLSKRDRANPYFVEALAVEKRNFGSLEFTGKGDTRKLIARCFDSNGEQQWQRVLASAKNDAQDEPAYNDVQDKPA